jgi:hypothetical protein
MKRTILALSIVMLTSSVAFAANDWFFNPANGDVIEGPVGSPQHYINLGPQPNAAAAQAVARSRQSQGTGAPIDAAAQAGGPEWFLNLQNGDVVQGPVGSPQNYVPLGRHLNAAAAQAAARSRQGQSATGPVGAATDPEWFLNPRNGDVVQGPVGSPQGYVSLGRHPNAAAAQAAAKAAGSALPRSR